MFVQGELDRGRYVLDREPIASGGMGTVWRGYDRKLKRPVAVKELRLADGLGESERDRQRSRVMAEARAAARLDHPAIVPVYDVIEDDGRPWIVMRLVPGRSLAQEVDASGPLSPRRTAEIGLQILAALGAAHAEGILHRDVKPQNVLLDSDGTALLTDFGIASITGATATQPLTATGTVVGTVGYMAPERLAGGAIGPGSDLWSLGATLYFAVEGRPAYPADDVVAVIAAVVSRGPEPTRRAGVLAPVIEGLLVRDAAARWDAAATEAYLRAVVAGAATDETAKLPAGRGAPTTPHARTVPDHALPPTAHEADAGRDPGRPARRRPLRWAAASVAAAALLAGGIAIGAQLGSDHRTATSKSTTAPSDTNRFTAAPKTCQSSLLSPDRLGALLPHAQADGGPVDTAGVNRCDFKTDDRREFLRVAIVRHGTVAAARKDYDDSDAVRTGTGARPSIGDQAFLASEGSGDRARVRISNLTIDVRYGLAATLSRSDDDKLLQFVRQLVAAVEAEAQAAST